MMKKTLVALAAVAVTGGAFAQATMTGFLASGYRSTQTTAGVTASGMGVDTANIDFAVAEDIEGLGKVSGKLGVALKNKDTTAASRDSELAIDFGAAGKVKMSNYYSASWLGGTAAGNANQYCSFSYGDCAGTASNVGMFSTYGYNDEISYTIPLTSTLSASVNNVEPSTTASGAGLGSGQAGYTDSQRYNTYSLTYKPGKELTITGGYRTYDRANEATGNSSYRHRAAFNYDLGAAQIGAGYEQTTTTYGATTTDTLMSLVLPVPSSALTLSAQFGNRTKAGNASSSSDTTYSGTIYNAVYKLSGRTDLLATYATNQAAGTSNPTFLLATWTRSLQSPLA
jgi:hypothetical protein